MLTKNVNGVNIPISPEEEVAILAEWTANHPDKLTNIPGFIAGLKVAVGGPIQANLLMRSYPMFYDAVAARAWDDAQALIIDAHTTGILNDVQYSAFKVLVTKFNIPLVLP